MLKIDTIVLLILCISSCVFSSGSSSSNSSDSKNESKVACFFLVKLEEQLFPIWLFLRYD